MKANQGIVAAVLSFALAIGLSACDTASSAEKPKTTDTILADDLVGPVQPKTAASQPQFLPIPRQPVITGSVTGTVTSRAPSTLGGLDSWGLGFGYNNGHLVYNRVFEPRKVVHMAMQEGNFAFFCNAPIALPAHIGGVAKVNVVIQTAYAPSTAWEQQFHRLVALWGKGDGGNTVTSADVTRGVGTSLAAEQEFVCLRASKKTVVEVLENPTLTPIGYSGSFASDLRERMLAQHPEWELKVTSVTAGIDDDTRNRLAAAALKPPAKPVAVKKPQPAPAPCATTVVPGNTVTTTTTTTTVVGNTNSCQRP